MEGQKIIWMEIIDRYSVLVKGSMNPGSFSQSKNTEMLRLKDILRISKNTSPSPLHIAAETGDMELCSLLLEELVVADKNPIDIRQWTPLHSAASMGQISVLRFFIEHSLDVNMRTKNGYTVLHLATINGHFEICEILINIVDQKNPKDHSGKTPIDFALDRGHVKIFWLLKHHNPTTEIDHKKFLKFVIDDNIDPSDRWTHIHCASRYGDLESCQQLINKSVDLNIKTIEGETPLHLAAQHSHEQGGKTFQHLDSSIKIQCNLDLVTLGLRKNCH